MTARLIHLKWVLVDQILDLTTATHAIRSYATTLDTNIPINHAAMGHFRMCTTFAIISLAKLWEALDHYSIEIKEFPADLKSECSALKKKIGEEKKIYQYRSKYAAHIIDKSTKAPISLVDGEKRYSEIVGKTLGELLEFCNWINPDHQKFESNSVLSTVIKIRDHCISVVGSCSDRP